MAQSQGTGAPGHPSLGYDVPLMGWHQTRTQWSAVAVALAFCCRLSPLFWQVLFGCLLYKRHDISFCHQVFIAVGTSSVGHFLCCGFFKEIVALLSKAHRPFQGVRDF